MRMPSGKFKGQDLSSLDDDYLDWLAEAIDLKEPLRSAVERERASRQKIPASEWIMTDAVIDAGYRALTRKLHPDIGGSHEEMVLLNRIVERLRRIANKS